MLKKIFKKNCVFVKVKNIFFVKLFCVLHGSIASKYCIIVKIKVIQKFIYFIGNIVLIGKF